MGLWNDLKTERYSAWHLAAAGFGAAYGVSAAWSGSLPPFTHPQYMRVPRPSVVVSIDDITPEKRTQVHGEPNVTLDKSVLSSPLGVEIGATYVSPRDAYLSGQITEDGEVVQETVGLVFTAGRNDHSSRCVAFVEANKPITRRDLVNPNVQLVNGLRLADPDPFSVACKPLGAGR